MSPSVPPRPVFIYSLADPQTGEIRYIGRTMYPQKRFYNHLMHWDGAPRTAKRSWIMALQSRGLAPVMALLETADEETWPDAERRQIALHRAADCCLTNLTDGGVGAPGHATSAHARRVISATHKGRAKSAETRAKMSAASKGRPKSAAHVAKMAASKRGKPAPNKGKTLAPAAVARIAAAHKRRVWTAEMRAHQAQKAREHWERMKDSPEAVALALRGLRAATAARRRTESDG